MQNKFCRLSTMRERDRHIHTDRQTENRQTQNGNIDRSRRNRLLAMSPN